MRFSISGGPKSRKLIRWPIGSKSIGDVQQAIEYELELRSVKANRRRAYLARIVKG